MLEMSPQSQTAVVNKHIILTSNATFGTNVKLGHIRCLQKPHKYIIYVTFYNKEQSKQ